MTLEMLAHGIVYHRVYGTASNGLVLCFVYLKLNLETFFFSWQVAHFQAPAG